MRKFNQLILIIVSLISIVLLLIYRHEYNRLRYVLEVFNFFGQPPQCNYLEFLNSSTLKHHDWGPTPVWQVLETSQVYSAFLKSDTEVEALAIASNNGVVQNCYVWIENKQDPVIGKYKYSKIAQINEDKMLYKFHCSTELGTPYAVSFSSKNQRAKFKKVLLPHSHKIKTNFTTVCVLPSDVMKANIFEFISYYKLIGADSFIIYNNLPRHILYLLESTSSKLGIHIVNYPWNYPGSAADNIRTIIEQDCLLRTKNASKNVLILSWRDFIIPRYHHTLTEVLDRYDPDNKIQRFTLRTLIFCIMNQEHSEPITLQNLYYDTLKSEEMYMYRSGIESDTINTQLINSDILANHKYMQCAYHPSHSKREDSIKRFASNLRKSLLVKLIKQEVTA